MISNGSNLREIDAAAPAAPRNRAAPSTLPFTGTDTALLMTLGLVLLLGGSGLAVATRRERTVRTAA